MPQVCHLTLNDYYFDHPEVFKNYSKHFYFFFFSVSEVTEALREDGLTMSKTAEGIQDKEDTFAIDGHCPNVLVFHPGCKEDLTSHALIEEGKLILQVGLVG